MGCAVATRSVPSEHAPVTVRVPYAASSVAVARRQLTAWMRARGLARAVVEDGRVVISELVANAVRHAQPLSDGTILITWFQEDDGLRISVTDGGSASSRPHTLHTPSSDVSGRGMVIVEALAGEWWSERTRTRSTIHTRLPLP